MIKLLLNPYTQPHALSFEKSSISIGSGSEADILIENEELLPTHVKIEFVSGSFYVINCANDPLVSLNGLPFGKNVLTLHDEIQINNLLIRFESEEKKEDTPKKNTFIDLPDEFETVNSKNDATQSDESNSFFHTMAMRMGLVIMIGISLFSALAIAAIITYVSYSEQAEKEAIIAAEGVSNVAMALTYAQVNHIKPQKENWFDLDFLKNNLSSILSSEYLNFSNIDNQGQFEDCSYILRIYTGSDLSQYVVIAQPEPSFFQWLIPKSTVVVNSKSMELRSLSDLKTLNRLLANPNALEGNNGVEISDVIKQGDLIPLSSFGNHRGFNLPKIMAFIHPGSENRIYNAPRYFHLTDAILKKAAYLLHSGNQHDLIRLQQQIAQLSLYPNIILYSSQGLLKASIAQKALQNLAPDNPFITAFLNFDKKGEIVNSYLLFSDGYYSQEKERTPLIKEINNEIAEVTDSKSSKLQYEFYHPMLIPLIKLSTERQYALKAIGDEISALLQKHINNFVPNYDETLSYLMEQFDKSDLDFQNQFGDALRQMYNRESAISFNEFLGYIKDAKLEELTLNSLKFFKRNDDENFIEKLQVELSKISLAKTFESLDKTVSSIAELLNLNNLPDPQLLIYYQNELHNKTLAQLRLLLFSANVPLPKDTTQANHSLISHLLKKAWVSDMDECNYYLSEFDLLAK